MSTREAPIDTAAAPPSAPGPGPASVPEVIRVARTVFGCARCHARFTPALRPLPSALATTSLECCTEVPSAWWTLRDDPRGRPDHPAVVHPHDTRNLVPHEELSRRIGCCGVSYRAGLPNLRCARCGAEAGYELSDGDHCAHAVFLSSAERTEVAVTEPDDACLLARFEARRDAGGDAPADQGMAALPRALSVDLDAVWGDDTPRVTALTALGDFAVCVAGTSLRLRLDGVWVRPPWPAGERERMLALGAIPRGGARSPLFWWSDLAVSQGDPDRHRWSQWRVGGEVCVLWERWPGAQSRDGSHVAFRLPWSRWLGTWRAALASDLPWILVE